MRAAKILSGILSGLAIAACSCEPSPPPEYSAFGSPELISIIGYVGDAMEPFISRGGDFLFFNTNGGGPTDKDLFYASLVDGATFQYQGAITDINTAEVDGAPTLDAANTFYYVSTDGYDPPAANATLLAGAWNGNTVTGSAPLAALTVTTSLILYFDVEASPDGSTLYLSRGDFRSGGGVPSSADISFAVDSGGGFVLDANGAAVMANVNTDKLEYAPAISADGLELFFTRFDPGTAEARIYRAVRSSGSGAFGPPQLVRAVEGFVEGPAFSPDEKSLYYHRKNTGTELYEIYRVTRP